MQAWPKGRGFMLESSHIVAFAAATDLNRARAFYEQVPGLPVAEQNDFACVIDAHGTMLRITAVPEVCRAGYTVLGVEGR
jgi:catechol-2,3-dioxygenase